MVLFFKWISHHVWGKFSDLQCSFYCKMHVSFTKKIPPLAWSDHESPHVNSPHKFALKCLSPHEKLFLEKKSPPYLRGERHHVDWLFCDDCSVHYWTFIFDFITFSCWSYNYDCEYRKSVFTSSGNWKT